MKFDFRKLSRGLALLGLLLAGRATAADNPFADIIRKTEPLTPEREQAAFHLPPGFEIELVAAEPEIGKPINMAFDEKGRLWVTLSREYPFPAPEDKPKRDTIKILSNFGADGRAQKITTFADQLNIPIGVYPYRNGAIAYSIPYIYHFADTNGDDRADVREPFLGRFGFERDTHGMTSSFRRGFDGWLYANHGYNNISTLTAKDGSSITMQSGNTYRVKIDGSHIEQFVWGRVNPFGLMFDPLGNIFSSDCETFPIYQLLRGGYYPSFGKPDDGLGFAPAMMDHKHGSTAIAGLVYYAATNFPPEFRDNVFVGNVMTCRIDRDSLEPHGSTSIAREQPDFLVSDDPWFRPVDMQLGPDGALYVADFYNRIIGHYEVPLDNPGRDRERGRIWRISYRGENAPAKTPPLQNFNLAKSSTAELIKQLGNSNITVRMLAMNELTDRVGPPAIKPVEKIVRDDKANVWQRVHGLWLLYRFNALDPKLLAEAAHDPDRALRVHATRVYSELTTLAPDQYTVLAGALQDSDALVRRAAADALGQHPRLENIRPLLDARSGLPPDDTHLLYVLRMALRNQLAVPENFARLPLPSWSATDEAMIADVALAVPSAESARFLLRHLQDTPETREKSVACLRHIARYLPDTETAALADFARSKFADDLDFQLALFKSVEEGTAQRGTALGEPVKSWGRQIATQLAGALSAATESWMAQPLEGTANTGIPWALQNRSSADGDRGSRFISSLPAGEQLTGVLRSKSFVIPPKLSFFLAGHDGFPDHPANHKNAVRLRAADTREILAETFPPRNDLAQAFTWDLSAHAGKQGFIEIVDADDGTAYAWLAVGRFEPAVVDLPLSDPRSSSQRKQSVAELTSSLKITSLEPTLAGWLESEGEEPSIRGAAAHALITLNPEAHIAIIGRLCGSAAEPAILREQMGRALAESDSAAARVALIDSLKFAPERLQIRLALALAGSANGAEDLLKLAEARNVPARVLLDRSVRERVNAAKPENADARIATLTKGLIPINEQVQKIIDARRAAYNSATARATEGAKVFVKTCAVCHSIDNQGGAVGPHLDGAGNRGLERLLEDVLDPSRNVDPSFHASTITLKNGDVITGLQRREEGEVIVFVDATGKETPVAKSAIESRVESQLSLMPDNFSEVIPPADFNNLMAFLLSKASSAPAAR